MGIYLIRGENIALIGEIDPLLDSTNPLLTPASWEEVQQLEKEEELKLKQEQEKKLLGATTGSSSTSVTGNTNISGTTSSETIIRAGWRMD